jgi:hypothetical protein
MFSKRAAFWGGMYALITLTPFVNEVIANKVPALGLQRFIAFSHRGGPAS